MSWNTEATKKAKKATILAALERSDVFVVNSLKAVYARQTADERGAEVTVHQNGRGFTGFDAHILSSFAKQVEKWEAAAEKRFPSPLSPKQMATARKMIGKYWAQLIEVADEKAAREAAPEPVEAEPVYYLDGQGCDSGLVEAGAQETPQGF